MYAQGLSHSIAVRVAYCRSGMGLAPPRTWRGREEGRDTCAEFNTLEGRTQNQEEGMKVRMKVIVSHGSAEPLSARSYVGRSLMSGYRPWPFKMLARRPIARTTSTLRTVHARRPLSLELGMVQRLRQFEDEYRFICL
jgi:hypothetical protein